MFESVCHIHPASRLSVFCSQANSGVPLYWRGIVGLTCLYGCAFMGNLTSFSLWLLHTMSSWDRYQLKPYADHYSRTHLQWDPDTVRPSIVRIPCIRRLKPLVTTSAHYSAVTALFRTEPEVVRLCLRYNGSS